MPFNALVNAATKVHDVKTAETQAGAVMIMETGMAETAIDSTSDMRWSTGS